jgi:hypothetical protein
MSSLQCSKSAQMTLIQEIATLIDHIPLFHNSIPLGAGDRSDNSVLSFASQNLERISSLCFFSENPADW